MYCPIFNRICGWLYFALGMVGFTSGRLGNYIHVSLAEAIAYTALGVFGMIAARLRWRDATMASVLYGILLLLWGFAGFAWPNWPYAQADPLEAMLRVLSGLWGMYCTVTDVLSWRRTKLANPPQT
ncbi:hypothetical protein GCM10025857_30880 [Alicyclobacillus contaminans]|uniref:hypothetical protein n=1 Tax=Alicyclobacillus contaminans TaxID=392016 RepID=UPI00042052BC|nr:hypothetical protein [Alicyclobacillus contaminans]GMA51731.1 hypothetical protein GCM10025857_30880 [Alicyclobacillus contaminans]